MDSFDISMVIFVAVIAAALVYGIVRIIKKNAANISTVDDLIDYLTSDEAKDKILKDIIPKLTEDALEEYITSSVNYETFKLRIVDSFTDKIYNFVEEHIDDLSIDDALRKFINKDSISVVCDKLFEIDEVDMILSNCYTHYINNSIADGEKAEQDALDTIAKMDAVQGPEPEQEYLDLHEPDKVEHEEEPEHDTPVAIPDDSTEVIENSETVEHVYPDTDQNNQ